MDQAIDNQLRSLARLGDDALTEQSIQETVQRANRAPGRFQSIQVVPSSDTFRALRLVSRDSHQPLRCRTGTGTGTGRPDARLVHDGAVERKRYRICQNHKHRRPSMRIG